MPAIDTTALLSRSEEAVHLLKRANFASRNPGVILVFCIIGTVVLLLIGLSIHKRIAARRAAAAS